MFSDPTKIGVVFCGSVEATPEAGVASDTEPAVEMKKGGITEHPSQVYSQGQVSRISYDFQ